MYKGSVWYKNITVNDLKKVMERGENIQILDVRLASECKNEAILNAMQINLISSSFETKAINVLDKGKSVCLCILSFRK